MICNLRPICSQIKKKCGFRLVQTCVRAKILQSHLKEDFLQRRARSPNYRWSLVPLFLSSLIQVKAVNFAAGDKVGEGDIMVEIEHHPDH